MFFGVWLILLGFVFVRLIQDVAYSCGPFIHIVVCYSVWGTYLIHSTVVGHMDDFQSGAAINSAAMDIFICMCLLVNLMAIFV